MKRAALVLCISAGALTACRGSRAGDTFVWHDAVRAGQRVTIHNLNGPVRVRAASGPDVEIRAAKHYKGWRPERVRFVVTTTDEGAVVCALWGSGGECSESDYRAGKSVWPRILSLRSDVQVEFTVAVPSGVLVNAQTTNGGVTVEGVGAPVKAGTVNGSIRVATSAGPVTASTVNGSIVARVDSFAAVGPMTLTTVNGSVTAELPGALDATVDMQTVNGRVDSDFPLTVTGAVSSKRLRGTVGGGGREIKLETVNGRVAVRRGA
jgi:hypothetical protein